MIQYTRIGRASNDTDPRVGVNSILATSEKTKSSLKGFAFRWEIPASLLLMSQFYVGWESDSVF